ncbi:hypothetical protein AQ505_13000 [Pedobacter sp. PACM 27299]|uniref:hypothetical protein n=1 Tax=Pedobacter sp. PACM 27299 TaxID=1727164 RepID=UPI000705E32D|nr:hypothetical protein [Pedobacter sp. PACM 27299]ALL06336.1 hypothetical protein AQ505_13000 [Pedobacter sp. PACM 27299]
MEPEELIERLNIALGEFCREEPDLFLQDAHEEAISTAFIKYLTNIFEHLNLNIDGQWDKRMIDNVVQKKQTDFLITQLPISKRNSGEIIDDETIRKEVLPDIILHRRQDCNHNFLAIEIKKSTNLKTASKSYDHLKLSVYTNSDLNYNYGAYIEFCTGKDYKNEDPFSLIIFQNGVEL